MKGANILNGNGRKSGNIQGDSYRLHTIYLALFFWNFLSFFLALLFISLFPCRPLNVFVTPRPPICFQFPLQVSAKNENVHHSLEREKELGRFVSGKTILNGAHKMPETRHKMLAERETDVYTHRRRRPHAHMHTKAFECVS